MPMNMNVKVADFVSHTVTDLTESVSFYRDTLGLELEMLNKEGDLPSLPCHRPRLRSRKQALRYR